MAKPTLRVKLLEDGRIVDSKTGRDLPPKIAAELRAILIDPAPGEIKVQLFIASRP